MVGTTANNVDIFFVESHSNSPQATTRLDSSPPCFPLRRLGFARSYQCPQSVSRYLRLQRCGVRAHGRNPVSPIHLLDYQCLDWDQRWLSSQ